MSLWTCSALHIWTKKAHKPQVSSFTFLTWQLPQDSYMQRIQGANLVLSPKPTFCPYQHTSYFGRTGSEDARKIKTALRTEPPSSLAWTRAGDLLWEKLYLALLKCKSFFSVGTFYLWKQNLCNTLQLNQVLTQIVSSQWQTCSVSAGCFSCP